MSASLRMDHSTPFMECDELLRDLLQPPVQEGSPDQAHVLQVSLGKEYMVSDDRFLSGTADYHSDGQYSDQQEDYLNRLVGSQSMNAVSSFGRSPSVELLLEELDKPTEGDVNDMEKMQEVQEMEYCECDVPLEVFNGNKVPETKLHSVCNVAELENLQVHPFPNGPLHIDEQLERAMTEPIQQAGNTSNTSISVTYEYSTVEVTQGPHLPDIKDEQPSVESLPKLAVFQTQPKLEPSSSLVSSPPSTLPEMPCDLLSPVSERSSDFATDREDSISSYSVNGGDKDEIPKMAMHIKKKIEQLRRRNSDATDSKVQVHEVVIFILLHDHCDCRGEINLGELLCRTNDKQFMVKNTKKMGLLWQNLKGNRNGNYDTFARAMRVGRERKKGYFDYLDTGKGSKKRQYQLASEGCKELKKMESLLRYDS